MQGPIVIYIYIFFLISPIFDTTETLYDDSFFYFFPLLFSFPGSIPPAEFRDWVTCNIHTASNEVHILFANVNLSRVIMAITTVQYSRVIFRFLYFSPYKKDLRQRG